MPHIPFYTILPEIAEKETRTIVIKEHYNDLPKGEYGFIELYCDDIDCDCRNVYIQVINRDNSEVLATISYGWESIKFYKDWIGFEKVDNIIKQFKGPSLTIAKQSVYANTLLEIFKELLKDSSYAERLKRHYKLFKNEIKKRVVLENQMLTKNKIGRNEPCSCGSGRKYKKCCGI